MINIDFREKYRPRTLKEVIGNEKPKKAIIKMAETGEVRRGIFFHGPVGTGKTTLARILVKALHCKHFTDDVCGKCASCLSFEKAFPGSNDYDYHDCSKMTGRNLDEILKSLGFDPGISTFSISRTKLHIHIFDEFYRAKEPLQDKFLIPLETHDNILLIFCSVEPTVSPALRRRTLNLPTSPPEIGQLVPWLEDICMAEKILIKDSNALRQVAESTHRLPGECLRILEQVYLEDEPLSTSIVREIAQNTKFTIVE